MSTTIRALAMKWAPNTRRKIIRAWLEVLQLRLPLDITLTVGAWLPPCTESGHEWATVELSNGAAVIRFASNVTRDIAQDTVVHEFAHLMDGRSFWGDSEEAHDEIWGAYYSRAYRALRWPSLGPAVKMARHQAEK